MNKKIQILFILFSVVFVIICYIYYWKNILINTDATYYLGSSRLIYSGNVPYVDFYTAYPPLAYYIMGIVFWLFGDSYHIGLSCIYIVNILNSILLYFLVDKVIDHKYVSIFCSLYFLLLCCCFEGVYFFLEPFVLFFGMLSIMFVVKLDITSLILSGFFSFCAFWCKQYGLGFLLLGFIYTLISTKRISKLSIIFIGFLLGSIFFISMLLSQGAALTDLFGLSGSTYERFGFYSLLECSVRLVEAIPPLAVAILMLGINLKRLYKNPIVVLSILGFGGFLLQCYVRNYNHYLLLVIPFAVMLIGLAFKYVNNHLYKFMLVTFCIICFSATSYKIAKDIRYWQKDGGYRHQIEAAAELAKIIPIGSKNVYISERMLPIGYINNYIPPLITKYGLSNGFVTSKTGTLDLLESASFCIINDKDFEDPVRFEKDVVQYIYKNFELLCTNLSLNGTTTSVWRSNKKS